MESSPSGPLVSVSTTSPDNAELNSLKAEVEHLSESFTRLKKENSSFWTRVAIVLGVLGGLIAIPKGAKDAFDAVVNRPNTQVNAQDMAVFYNPIRAAFVIRVPILVANAGNEDDLLSPSATISYASASGSSITPKENLYPGEGSLRFSDKGTIDEVSLPSDSEIPLPIQLPKGTSKTVFCSVESDREFLARPGQDTVEIQLSGKHGGSYSAKMCFALDGTQITELETKHATSGKRWFQSNCN